MGMVQVEGLQTIREFVLSSQEVKALQSLRESRQSVALFHSDPWQFALELRDFESQRISPTTLRCLVERGLVAHGIEQTNLEAVSRSVVPVGHLRFTENSSFILTDLGLALAGEAFADLWPSPSGAASTVEADVSSALPRFIVCDNGCRELRYRGKVVKIFKTYADRQETVLQSFQDQNWVEWIADPLTSGPRQNPKIGLRDVIARLNRHQMHNLLRFHGDGTGRGVRWCAAAASHNKDATRTQQSNI
jgi:hypothetical protein